MTAKGGLFINDASSRGDQATEGEKIFVKFAIRTALAF